MMTEKDVAGRAAAKSRHAAQQTDTDPVHAASACSKGCSHRFGDYSYQIKRMHQEWQFG